MTLVDEMGARGVQLTKCSCTIEYTKEYDGIAEPLAGDDPIEGEGYASSEG